MVDKTLARPVSLAAAARLAYAQVVLVQPRAARRLLVPRARTVLITAFVCRHKVRTSF